VLPFKDLSPQHDQDYFCEGLAEELINALTQVKGMKVPARTSSFSFKGKEEDIREIGRQLNVGSILEGSVQKAGNRLRVTAQLISVSDGYHLWAERFDRNIEDIFTVQDEIAMAVVEKLKVELLEGEQEKITKRHTQNKEAYQGYLKGRYHWNRRSPKDMVLAVDNFQRAIDKDQGCALPANGKVKYPEMAEKMTHLIHGIKCCNAIESSSSIKEELFLRRGWDVRSGHAYNHKNTF
jgi:TolB-like protein